VKFPLASAAALLVLLAAQPAEAKKKPRDTIPAVGTLIDNVSGATPDGKGGIERFTGLLIGDDGHVLEVYRQDDKRPERVAYRLDGQGRVMVPGLVDAHARVMDTGLAQMTLDLSPARSLDEALSRVAAWAAAHSDMPWILGSGWNESAWDVSGRMPTAAELDAVTGGKPAWLTRAVGEAGWANRAALAAAGITAATPDPSGGRIERVAGSKAPSGVLHGTAADLVAAKAPPPRPDDRDLALAKAQLVFLKQGVTTVTDMGTSIEDWQTYRRAGDLGKLRLRIVSYADGIEDMALIGGAGPSPWLYGDRLKMNGLHLVYDGAIGSRGAQMKAAYSDAPGVNGVARLNSTQLGNLMSRAAFDNFQVAIDVQGDAAIRTALDTVAELGFTYKGDRRWRIEGAQAIDAADIRLFGEGGVIASMQPAPLANDRAMLEARLGPARIAGAHAWKSIAATGATLAFGSDTPGGAPAPFLGMAVAISRQGTDGEPWGGWQPQEILSREAALSAYTWGGAKAAFADDRLGRIAKGYRADFLFLDRDPLLASPGELRQVKVLETWVNGQMVWSAARDASGATKPAPEAASQPAPEPAPEPADER